MKTKLISNIISLLSLKGAQYIISFITLPFLLRVLGPEKFGAISFAQVLVNYGILCVDYGFNLTAPRDIAKANKSDVPYEFSAIFYSKLLILAVVMIIGCFLFTIFDAYIDILLILCVIPMLIGNVLFPIWYYQGIENMKYITGFDFIGRVISVVLIFTLITDAQDYLLAAFLQSISPMIAGIISLSILIKTKRELFIFPTYNMVILKIKDGWEIFISTLFINLYTNSNIFILGILTNDTCVGYYSAASKLIDAIKGIYTPISNAIFPHVSLLFQNSKETAIHFLRKITRITSIITLLLSVLVFVFSENIVKIVMGSGYDHSIALIKILSVLPLIVSLSNIYGVQTMVAFGMQSIFSRILMISAIINFVIVFPMVYFFQDFGLAITMVLVESFVTIMMYIELRKNKINLYF